MSTKKLIKNKQQKKYIPVLLIFIGFIILLNLTVLVNFIKFFINPRYWNDKTLMAGIFIYLFYLQFRKTNFTFKPTYQVRYLLLSMVIVLIGNFSGTDFLLWIGLGFSIYSVLIYFFGGIVANNFIMVLMFLIFMGRLNSPTALNLISLYLRLISTKISAFLLNIAGIVTQAQGSYLITEKFNCTVGEACNGLHNLVSLFYVTFVFCYLQKTKLKNTLVLLFISVFLAVIANSLRITTMVVVGYFWGRHLIQPDSLLHTLIGIFYFIVAMGVIFYINKFLKNTSK